MVRADALLEIRERAARRSWSGPGSDELGRTARKNDLNEQQSADAALRTQFAVPRSHPMHTDVQRVSEIRRR